MKNFFSAGKPHRVRGALRFAKPLRSERGASLLFVLAIMMLLMAIGTSALVAASASSASGTAARLQNRMEVYANSVIKSFTANLQSDADIDMGRTLVRGIFEKNRTLLAGRHICTVDDMPAAYATADPGLAFGAVGDNGSFTLAFDPVIIDKIAEIPAVPATFVDADGNSVPSLVPGGAEVTPAIPRVPSFTVINSFKMTLNIPIKLQGKTITRWVTFECTGAEVTFKPDDPITGAVDETTADPDYTFKEWRVADYGKLG